VTREAAAISPRQDGSDTGRRPVPAQTPYSDLDLLTPDDVCALLKVKKSWLYDTVENGALEVIRLGKQLRFRPSALLRYLEGQVSDGSGADDIQPGIGASSLLLLVLKGRAAT
jgi:excisionase family DNA binding protein